MEIKLVTNSDLTRCVYVDGGCRVHRETYAVAEQVIAALRGEHWPNTEAKEIARNIKKEVQS